MQFRSNPVLRIVIAAALLAGVPLLVHAGDKLDIVTEGGIGKSWAAAPGSSFAAPGYPAEMKDRAAQVCLNVGYTLGKDGVPTDLELLRSWSRDHANISLSDGDLDGFVQSAALALSQWRFVPRADVGRVRKTRTSATMVFRASNEISATAVADRCRISNLESYVADNSGVARRNTIRQILERTELQQQRERAMQVLARTTAENTRPIE